MTAFTALRRKRQHPVYARPLLGRAENQNPRQAVDDDRQAEQHQAEFDQRARVQLAGGLGELIGDHRGDRIARRKQRSVNLGIVADHHGHRHGFPQGARQGQENRAHDAVPRKGNDDVPGGFPRVAPSASAPSRCSVGTARITSRDIEMMNGTIMTASTTPADNMLTP